MMVAGLRQRYAPDARRVLCTFTAVLGVGGCAIAGDARAGAPAPPIRPLAELSYAQLHAFIKGVEGIWHADTAASRGEPAPPVRPLAELSYEQLRAFIKGVEGIWHADTAASRGEPAPPVYKPPPDGATLHALVPPERFDTRTLSLADAIARRRSRREFLSTPLTIEELSFLLWHTQGVTGALTLPGEETIDLRAAPSGGARYPLETYVFVQRVASLDPGLYRYLPATHQLVVIRHDPQIAATLQRACFGGTLIGDAAAVFAFSAVPYRTEWKYGWISHRMIAMEAGHAVQNLLLSAEAIGAGACAVAAYHQSSLDALLEVDGDSEFTLYLTAVGRVAAATPEPEAGEPRQ